MPHVEHIIRIEAPPEAVWSLLSDLSRTPEYVHFVREVSDISDAPAREGTTYRERSKRGPFEFVSEWRITKYEAPRMQVHERSMPDMNANLTMRLEPEGGGTRFVQSMDYELLPKLRPLGQVMESLFVTRNMQSDFRRIQESIKRIVEAEAAQQPAQAEGSGEAEQPGSAEEPEKG